MLSDPSGFVVELLLFAFFCDLPQLNMKRAKSKEMIVEDNKQQQHN